MRSLTYTDTQIRGRIGCYGTMTTQMTKNRAADCIFGEAPDPDCVLVASRHSSCMMQNYQGRERSTTQVLRLTPHGVRGASHPQINWDMMHMYKNPNVEETR